MRLHLDDWKRLRNKKNDTKNRLVGWIGCKCSMHLAHFLVHIMCDTNEKRKTKAKDQCGEEENKNRQTNVGFHWKLASSISTMDESSLFDLFRSLQAISPVLPDFQWTQ